MQFKKIAGTFLTGAILAVSCTITVLSYNSTDITNLRKYLLDLPILEENYATLFNVHEDYDESENPIIDIRDLVAMEENYLISYNTGEDETPFLMEN